MSLRQLFGFAFILLLFSACGDKAKPEDQFRIDGQFKGRGPNMVYLHRQGPLTSEKIDSVEVGEEGDFRFQRKAEPGQIMVLKGGDRTLAFAIPENDHIKLTVNSVGPFEYTVDGNVRSLVLQSLSMNNSSLYADYIKKKRELSLLDRRKEWEAWCETEAVADGALMAYRDYLRTFMDTVPYPELAGLAATFLDADGNHYYLREYYPKLKEKQPSSPFTLQVRKNLDNAWEELGKWPKVVLRAVDQNGDSLRPSDMEGKMTLVYFWASYCAFSREENKAFTEFMKENENSRFNIVAWSVDEDEAAWRKAIWEDQMNWGAQLNGNISPAGEARPILPLRSLPTTYLLDGDGRVVAKNVRAADLVQDFEKLLSRYGGLADPQP